MKLTALRFESMIGLRAANSSGTCWTSSSIARFSSRDEAGDIGPRGGERCRVVEGVIAIASAVADLEGQSSLSTLARSVDEDDWRVRECGDEGEFRQSAV
jgi:hypothetical protein